MICLRGNLTSGFRGTASGAKNPEVYAGTPSAAGGGVKTVAVLARAWIGARKLRVRANTGTVNWGFETSSTDSVINLLDGCVRSRRPKFVCAQRCNDQYRSTNRIRPKQVNVQELQHDNGTAGTTGPCHNTRPVTSAH